MVFSGDEETLAWGCSKCKGEEFQESDKLRILRNCDSSQNANVAWSWMPSLRRCPWSQTDDLTWMMLRWWVEWKEFTALPFGGLDIMDQPAYVLELFNMLLSLQNEIERDRLKKQQKETERANRKLRRKKGR